MFPTCHQPSPGLGLGDRAGIRTAGRRLGTPSPSGGCQPREPRRWQGPREDPRTKRIALTLLRPGRSHTQAARAPLPSLRSRAGPRLPLAVREAHIFPSSERPSASRQVRKANKSPAKSPRIYQSGGLSSSGRHPIRRKAASGERGCGAGRAAATPGGAGGGARMFAAPRGPEIYTGPSRSLPCALKSCGSGPGWGWGSQASSPRVLRVLIFAARPHCSYSGRF